MLHEQITTSDTLLTEPILLSPANNLSIRIDPEFQNLIPPLSSEEKLQLEANLKEFGCINPLVVWQNTGILLDGHHRYEICARLHISYRIVEIQIADRAAAINWIANHQLGRRNITPETASYLRGKRYLHLKGNRQDNLKQNSPSMENGSQLDSPNGNNFLSVEDDSQPDLPKVNNFLSVDMAKSLGEQYKVSDRTIRNDAHFTSALDTLAQALGEELKHSILARNAGLTKKDILSLASVVQEEGKESAQSLLERKLSRGDIVQQIKNKQRVPNPRHVGEVCQIMAKGDPDLKQFSGCWCIIFEVNPHSCAIRTWKMDFLTVRAENLSPMDGVCEDTASQNVERLRRLADKVYQENEPTHAAVLEALSRIPDPGSLTSKQERIISFLENEYHL